ncbi:MAG: hypothetical protein ACTH2Q_21455 [Propionibacteriaceae bacterium]
MTIIPTPEGDETGPRTMPGRHWTFRMPDGTEPKNWWTASGLTTHLTHQVEHCTSLQTDHRPKRPVARYADRTRPPSRSTTGTTPTPPASAPAGRANPFDLHALRRTLFSLQLPAQDTHQLAA